MGEPHDCSWLESLPDPFLSDLVNDLRPAALTALAQTGREGRQLVARYTAGFTCHGAQPASCSLLHRVLQARAPGSQLSLKMYMPRAGSAAISMALKGILALPAAQRLSVRHVKIAECVLRQAEPMMVEGEVTCLANLGSAFPGLQSLDVDAQVLYAGENSLCSALFAGLTACAQLSSITYRDWDFEFDGVPLLRGEDLQCADLPARLPHVRKLSVDTWDRGETEEPSAVQVLMAALGPQLTELKVGGCPPLTILRTCTNLQRVLLQPCGGLSDQLMSALLSLPALTHVEIHGICVDDPDSELSVNRSTTPCTWQHLHLSAVSLSTLPLLPAGIQTICFDALSVGLRTDPSAAAAACRAAGLHCLSWESEPLLQFRMSDDEMVDEQAAGVLLDGVLGAIAPLLQPAAHVRGGERSLDVRVLSREGAAMPRVGAATLRHLQTLLGDTDGVHLVLKGVRVGSGYWGALASNLLPQVKTLVTWDVEFGDSDELELALVDVCHARTIPLELSQYALPHAAESAWQAARTTAAGLPHSCVTITWGEAGAQ